MYKVGKQEETCRESTIYQLIDFSMAGNNSSEEVGKFLKINKLPVRSVAAVAA